MIRRGFSLIELLVVIAIIALLAGLALPAIVESRRNAQIAVGQVNLRSMHQILTSWTTDHRGEFLNAFAPGSGLPNPICSCTNPDYGFGYVSHSRYQSEGFMAYWYSYLAHEDLNGGYPIASFVSPADGDAVRQLRSTGAQADSVLPSGSFYYSPTFWKGPEAFTSSANCCSNEYGPLFRGDCCNPVDCSPVPCCPTDRLGIEMVSSPSAKVLVFERADFSQKQRVNIDGASSTTQPMAPAWNNPRARPSVATVDGAVTRADLAELTKRAAQASQDSSMLPYLPADLLNAPDLMPTLPLHGDGKIDGQSPTDGLYPMFFAATRDGIRGRDLAK